MSYSSAPSPAPARAAAAKARSRMRWAIVGFSALGLTIAYLDRAAISVAIPFISKEFHIRSRPAGCSTGSARG